MATPCFTNRSHEPTEDEILGALGRVAGTWTALFDRLRAEHPDLVPAWRFFNDGKSWLLNVSRGSKTAFWATVERGAFRVVFYFPERLCGALLASDLAEEVKARIRSGTATGKLRPVAVVFGPRRGVGEVMSLIALKKGIR
jgi:hypothetical protein